MTVAFPDSSNPGTVAWDKMMSPGRGRVNKDRDTFPRETGHSNQADGKGIEALWIAWPGCAQPCD
jgi:hypothetical protein